MRHQTINMLARVAAIYRLAILEQRSPVDALANDLGISPNAAKLRIRRARRSGQLEPFHGEVFDNPQ